MNTTRWLVYTGLHWEGNFTHTDPICLDRRQSKRNVFKMYVFADEMNFVAIVFWMCNKIPWSLWQINSQVNQAEWLQTIYYVFLHLFLKVGHHFISNMEAVVPFHWVIWRGSWIDFQFYYSMLAVGLCLLLWSIFYRTKWLLRWMQS